MHSEPVITRADRWPWLFAAAGCALDVAAFWPGLMSFDAAYAWSQARHGDALGITPPLFVLTWRITDALISGPGGLFALHLLLFWSGLALLAQALDWRPLRGGIALAGVALAPAVWLLRGHVWTDIGVLAALVCALGLLARAQRATRRGGWLGAALPCLIYAGLLRHNALPAIVPLALWWSALLPVTCSAALSRRTIVAVAGTLVMLVTLGAGRLLDARLRTPVPVWPSLAQFDLAGVSLQTRQMLLPASLLGPGLDLDELRAAFRPWSNLSLFTTRHGMRSPFEPPLNASELAALRTAWLDAIVHHPRAWLSHRWQVTRALLGTHAREWPAALIYVDAETAYGDNPPVAANSGGLHRAVMRAADALRDTPALAAWPYLLGGLCAAALAWPRRHALAGRVAWIALSSAWLLALPLSALAPAAELRYLAWPCMASLLALACCIVTPMTNAR